MSQVMFSLLATVLCFVSIFLLRICWRKLGGRYSLLRSLSWFGVLLSTGVWVKAQGVEFGLAYSAGVIGVFAWGIIYIDSFFKNKKTIEEKGKNKNVNKDKDKDKAYEIDSSNAKEAVLAERRKMWFSRLWLFLLCGPFTLVAMCFLSIVICFLMPTENSVRLVFSAFLYPLLVGLCMFWLCAKKSLLRHTLILSVITLVSALFLYVFSL